MAILFATSVPRFYWVRHITFVLLWFAARVAFFCRKICCPLSNIALHEGKSGQRGEVLVEGGRSKVIMHVKPFIQTRSVFLPCNTPLFGRIHAGDRS